jgi:predicted acetyltransferase
MGIEVRTITDDEVAAWCGAVNVGFLNPGGEVDAEARRPGLFLDRTWAAFDSARVVATLRSFPSELTVPGGAALRVGAVTAVTTTSTHRRRGLATRLVAAELAAAAERGEHASVLIAAEWQIYGRFGYGAATEHQTWTVDAGAARLRRRPPGTVEHTDAGTARALVPAVYERHRSGRPGELSRADRYWDLEYGLLRYPSWPEPKPAFHLVARDPAGQPVGVLRYTHEEKTEGRLIRGEVSVHSLFAADPAGHALLWDHLVSLDLVSTVRAADRPVDEVLPWLLADARHAQAGHRSDFLWVRPLDVPAMLAARRYLVPGRLVLQVADEAGPAAGRYALEGGPDGATCQRTGAAADLTLDAAVLGSAYLGGYRLRTLAEAGLVAEHRPGALAQADTMFRGSLAPWCSTWF